MYMDLAAARRAKSRVTTAMNAQSEEADGDIKQLDVVAVNSKANRPLYEARKKIHPKRAVGNFRNFKWFVMFVTLGIYYITPWLRWDRGEGLPGQAVLLDLANRRFYFFFIEIWPHEFFYVAGMLVMAGIGLFLVTSVLGRAWCGYTCPQTVWVDLFLVVERFFEGDRNARIKLDDAPWTASKIYKRVAKHTVWILIAVSTGGAWIFYFADAPSLLRDLFTGQAIFAAYATVATLTATTYILGAIMREQVCTYMCPWPRIQAAMLDEHSLTVTYNDWRGEPRSRHVKKMKMQGLPTGDCVDCNACVAVCPVGIDIRDGQQLECITCALCIDACDSVMNKLGIETGLISYATLHDYEANMALAGAGKHVPEPKIVPERIRDAAGSLSEKLKHFSVYTLLRTRTLIYFGIYAAIGLALLVSLVSRDRLDLKVINDRNPQFVVLSDGSIRNGYQLKILNMEGQKKRFLISMIGFPGAHFEELGESDGLKNWTETEVEADKLKSVRLFVTVPKEYVRKAKTEFTFVVSEIDGKDRKTIDAMFSAPKDN